MRKIGGLAVIAALTLAGCSAPAATPEPEIQPVAEVQQAPTIVQGDMLTELRPHLTTVNFDDATLISKAYNACANLIFRDKDSYREAVLKDYPNVGEAVDQLTIAAAGKKYLCP